MSEAMQYTENIKHSTQSIKRALKGDASFSISGSNYVSLSCHSQCKARAASQSFSPSAESSLIYSMHSREAFQDQDHYNTIWSVQKINSQKRQCLLYRNKALLKTAPLNSGSHKFPGYQNTAKDFIYIL